MKAKRWLKSYRDTPAEINADRYTSVVHMLEGAMQRCAAQTAFRGFGKTLSCAEHTSPAADATMTTRARPA